MLSMTMDQYEFAQFDFGRPTNIKLYEEDKATLFTGSGFQGVIRSYKRHTDGTFYYWQDVARGIAVTGFGAQVINDVPIVFTSGNNEGNFTWTKDALPTIPNYLWIKALLFKGGTGINDATELISSKFVRVYVEFGQP